MQTVSSRLLDSYALRPVAIRRGRWTLGLLGLLGLLIAVSTRVEAGIAHTLDDLPLVADCWNKIDLENNCEGYAELFPDAPRGCRIFALSGFETTRSLVGSSIVVGVDVMNVRGLLQSLDGVAVVEAGTATRFNRLAFDRLDKESWFESLAARGVWHEQRARVETAIGAGHDVDLVFCVRYNEEIVEPETLLAQLVKLRIGTLDVDAEGETGTPVISSPGTVELDTDGDGVGNGGDLCPFSNTDPTIELGTCSIPNKSLRGGCWISDYLEPCLEIDPESPKLEECVLDAFDEMAALGLGVSAEAEIASACSGGDVLGFNRAITSAEVIPPVNGEGNYEVRVMTAVSVFTSSPEHRDMSFVVEVRDAADALVAEIPIDAQVPGQEIEQCAGLGCPGRCGVGRARNQDVEMTCVDDEELPDACSCQLVCPGGWVGPLDLPGDLTIEIKPQPGTLPELDLAGDRVALAIPAPATPPNRSAGDVTLFPAGPGAYDILARVNFQTFTNVPGNLDLSARVRFIGDGGVLLGQEDVKVDFPGLNAGHCAIVPGCDTPCGHAFVNGVQQQTWCTDLGNPIFGCGCTVRANVWCRECPVEKCVTVEVLPLAGAEPEAYPFDDRAKACIEPTRPAAANRVVERVERRPIPGKPGAFEIVVGLAVEIPEATPYDRDLSTEVVIRREDGRVVKTLVVPIHVDGQDATTCGGLGCPDGPCGTGIACGETVDMECRPSEHFGDCVCTLRCETSCVDCQLEDENFVIETRPAPGAVGEVETRDDLVYCLLGDACDGPETPRVFFRENEHSGLGQARFHRDDDRLVVSNIGASGDDGVEIDLERPSDFVGLRWAPLRTQRADEEPGLPGWTIVITPRGTAVDELPALALELDGESPDLEYTAALSPGDEAVEIEIVALSLTSVEPVSIDYDSAPVGLQLWILASGYRYVIQFAEKANVKSDGRSARVDELVIDFEVIDDMILLEKPGAIAGRPPAAIDGLEIRLAGLQELEILSEMTFTGQGTEFERGNVNAAGGVDVSDGISVLNFLFLGAAEPPCLDAADANDSGGIDLSDGIAIFGFLFLGADPLPAPGVRACGPDPSEDDLGCESFAPCEE